MQATAQGQVEVVNAHLDVLPGPRELEDILQEHETEMKSKENTDTIKQHIIGPMN